MITDAELTNMRNAVESTLIDTCTINRPGAATVNEYGEQVFSPSTTITTNCRLSNISSGRDAVSAQRLANETPWLVTFSYDEDIQTTDTITVRGRTVEVQDVINGTAWSVQTRAYCSEMA